MCLSHRDHDLEQLLLASLGDLCLDVPEAGDDLALLVAKEPGHVTELVRVRLAGLGCEQKRL